MSDGTRFGGLSLLLLGLLGGCAGEVIESNSEQIQSDEQFLELYAQALCAPQQECCSDQDRQADPGCVTKTIQELRAQFGIGLDSAAPDALPARIRYNPQAGTECLKSARALAQNCSSASWNTARYECKKAFEGSVPQGEGCQLDVECESKPSPLHEWNHCEQKTASQGGEKSCVHDLLVPFGKPCAGPAVQGYDSVYCETPFRCNSETGVCDSQIPGPGEPCPNRSCINSYCNPSTLICEVLAELALGSKCEWFYECQSKHCSEGKCVAAPVRGDKCDQTSVGCDCRNGICHEPNSIAREPLCIVPSDASSK